MPLQLSAIVNATQHAEVRLKGFPEPVGFDYRQGYLTPAVLAAEEEARATGKLTDQLVQQVVGLVAAWEIFDGTDQLPVTEATVRTLPLGLLAGFIRAAFEDMNATGEATAAPSSIG